jgi:formylglycine-generating enzyme required for sulfatase activity
MKAVLREFLEEGGLEFAVVPAGTYPVGADPAQQPLLALPPQSTWRGYPLATRPQEVTAAEFAISTQPIRLSHWAKLRQRVPLEIPEARLAALAARQGGADEAWAAPTESNQQAARFHADRAAALLAPRRFARQPEADPVLEVSFAEAQAIAAALGASLPNWDEWEIATRGPDGWPYPWGATLDRAELALELQDYSVDDESTMGTYSFSEKVYFIHSFGRYREAVSPFGLGGLARAGREWNRCQERELPAAGDHILRSLADTGAMLYMLPGIQPYLSPAWMEQAHLTFSGPVLACYTPPTIAPKVYGEAGFRLVLRATQKGA